MCPLVNVQRTNLHLLIAVRVGLDSHPIDTCRAFGLQAEAAARLRAIEPDKLVSRVEAVGPTSLMLLRSDFMDLLEAPAQLAGTLAAAHPATPSADASDTSS
jgi:hypothetical protein